MRFLIETLFYWLSELLHQQAQRAMLPEPPPGGPEFVLGRALDTAETPSPRQNSLVTLDGPARRRNLHLLGGCGSGKSTLMRRLFLDDVRHGRAVFAADPRGDLADALLHCLAVEQPDLRPGRLLLIDLRNPARIPGFNPLAGGSRDAHGRAYFTLDVIRRHAETLGWGVLTEECLRSALTALAQAGGTLRDVQQLLLDCAFRQETLARVTDEDVLAFFKQYDAAGARQAQWSGPSLNKITPFTSLPALRTMLGGSPSISFPDLLKAHPDLIVIVTLNVDRLYQAGYLAGNLLVSAFQAAVLHAERAERRAEVTLYLDECQHFATPQLETLLSEGRRYGLSLCLAHQYLTQLPSGLREAVLNNVAASFYFQTGTDAQDIAALLDAGKTREVWRGVLTGQQIGECVIARRGQPARRVRLLPGSLASCDPAILEALKREAMDIYTPLTGKGDPPAASDQHGGRKYPSSREDALGRRGKRRTRLDPGLEPTARAAVQPDFPDPFHHAAPRGADPSDTLFCEESLYEVRHRPRHAFPAKPA